MGETVELARRLARTPISSTGHDALRSHFWLVQAQIETPRTLRGVSGYREERYVFFVCVR
jgi:hypothetical protein